MPPRPNVRLRNSADAEAKLSNGMYAGSCGGGEPRQWYEHVRERAFPAWEADRPATTASLPRMDSPPPGHARVGSAGVAPHDCRGGVA